MTSLPQVLIVEDDLTLANFTCEVLSEAGLPSIYRTSAIEAADALATHAASLRMLITDIQLGAAMTGVDLAVHVAQQWPHVSICVVSGIYPQRPMPLPLGALFLSKPCQAEQLIALARTACGPSSGLGT